MTKWMTMSVVAFFCICATPVHSGQIEQRHLYAKEKEAVEAADALAGLLIQISGRNISCPDCRKELRNSANAFAWVKYGHRDAVSTIQADEKLNYPQKRNQRFEAAEKAAREYSAARQRLSSGAESLCGKCSPPSGYERQKAMEKEFGSRGAQTVQGAMNDALRRLRMSAHYLYRCLYDDPFGKRVEGLFAVWMGKPTESNMKLVGECVDSLLASLIAKNLDPAAHIKIPGTFPVKEIRDASGDGRAIAFVYEGIPEAENLIFVEQAFFSIGNKGDILIHEEAHLLYGATDKGIRQFRSDGYRPPKFKGKSAILDAYSIVAFIEQLVKI